MPLKLSDAELDQLYAAARPIDVGLPSRTNVCDISQPFMLSNEARFQPYQSARLRRMILPMSEGLTCGGGNFSECSEARQQRGRLRQGRNNRAGYDELAC